MVLLSDGTRVVTANHGGVVWEHDLTTGQKRTLLRSRTILCNLALSPDGHVLFAGGGDPCLLLDLGTLASQPVSCLAGRQIFCAAFRGNRELFACDAEGNLLHIDLHRDVARIVVRGPEPPPADQPYDDYDGAYHPHHRLLAVSADGRRFAYSEVGNSSRFCVGETSPERWRQTSSVVGQVHSLAFSPDNRTLAGLIVGGALAFWDAVTCQKIGTFTWPGRRPSALSFAPDGTTLAVGYWDGTVQLWPWRALLDAR